MENVDGTGLPELRQERFEALEPPERTLAELLPHRPVLIGGRLHGAVALRLRAAGTWVEYVECSARTSAAMAIARSGQVVVMRREHDPLDRMCAGMLAAGIALFGWAVVLGLSGAGGMLVWGLCAVGPVAAGLAGAVTVRRIRRRDRRGRWSVLSEAEWGQTLGELDPMVADGATPSALVAAVDKAARFS